MSNVNAELTNPHLVPLRQVTNADSAIGGQNVSMVADGWLKLSASAM